VSLDAYLPEWSFRERHRRATPASAAALLAAAESVTWGEIPVMRTLMAVRSAGRLRLNADRRVLDGMAGIGFCVLSRTETELVLASIGRPWSVRGGTTGLADQAEPAACFVDFNEPGWAKMLANFEVVPGGLCTETRVHLTDRRSRAAFGAYWTAIRPFSGLIRHRWLAAITRRAERSLPPQRT
jgi:hypothetical protein